jgi:ribose transport system permease protein
MRKRLGFLQLSNISFAVPAILAVGLLVHLLSGVFDLSIGGTMDVASVFIGWLLIYRHVNEGLAIILVVLMGAVVGLVNAVLVAVVGVDSFIATLGASSVLLGVIATPVGRAAGPMR